MSEDAKPMTFRAEHFEGEDFVVTINGAAVGSTLKKSDALMLCRWLPSAWDDIRLRVAPDPLARLAVADALRKIEWSARDRYPDEDEEFRACPCCGSHELAGHTNDCALGTALGAARSSPSAASREPETPKPCQVCGGIGISEWEGTVDASAVQCEACGFRVEAPEETAVAAWNRRTTDPLTRLAVAHAEAGVSTREAGKVVRDAYARHSAEKSEESFAARQDADAKMNAAISAERVALEQYLAARSSPSSASREAELDRLAREVAEAGLETEAANDATAYKDHEPISVRQQLLINRTNAVQKERAALATYRAAKERTGT